MNLHLEGVLLACFILGIRHGFDYDHLAALTDIAAVQRSWWDGMKLGLSYAFGHAFIVFVLGLFVVLFRVKLPSVLDGWATRITGATLVALGLVILISLVRGTHAHPTAKGRWLLLIDGARYVQWRIWSFFSISAPKPRPFCWTYSQPSVFGIGVLHGLGAETPSQLMVFLLATSLGQPKKMLMGLLAFVIGLVLMNGAMIAGLGGSFLVARTQRRLGLGLAFAGAAYSLAVGFIFLLGDAGHLPPL